MSEGVKIEVDEWLEKREPAEGRSLGVGSTGVGVDVDVELKIEKGR